MDDLRASSVVFPITFWSLDQLSKFISFNNDALEANAFEATSSPGNIDPPKNSLLFEITSKTVAVPKSTTILNLSLS